MSIIDINWNPSDKHLRDFARIGLIAFVLIAAILYWVKDVNAHVCLSLAAAGLVIFILSLLSLKIVRVIYITFTALTFPIGLAVSFIMMAIVYYLLITPIALFFKLIGRDALSLKRDTNADTYWLQYDRPADNKRYFNQF